MLPRGAAAVRVFVTLPRSGLLTYLRGLGYMDGLAALASLPEAFSYSGHGVTVVEERELWDMPALLILLMALMGCEWAYRRTKGLA